MIRSFLRGNIVRGRDFFICGKYLSICSREKYLFRTRDTLSCSYNISDTWGIHCMLSTQGLFLY